MQIWESWQSSFSVPREAGNKGNFENIIEGSNQIFIYDICSFSNLCLSRLASYPSIFVFSLFFHIMNLWFNFMPFV